MVAPIASTVRLPLSPLHVLLPAVAMTGLSVASVAVFNQIRAVDRRRLIKKLGSVDADLLHQVDTAIRVAFGLDAEEPGGGCGTPPITNAIARSTKDLRTGRYEG
jgi:hypothetical protein